MTQFFRFNPNNLSKTLPSSEPLLTDIVEVFDNYQTPRHIETLHNADEIPEQLLSAYAYELNSDVFKANWSIEYQRNVLKNARQMQAKKGTVSSIKMALNSLGIDIELKEWWQQTPKATPFSFSLIAWANDNLTNENPILNITLYKDINVIIDQVKPVRSSFTFKVGVKYTSRLKAVSSCQSLAINKAEATAVHYLMTNNSTTVSCSMTAISQIRQLLTLTHDCDVSNSTAITNNCQAIQFISIQTECLWNSHQQS